MAPPRPRDGNDGAILRIERSIQELGGLATTAELLERGYWADYIRMTVDYGRIIRVRKGWYASLDTPFEVIRACRVGGRLACLSALAYHGLIEPAPGTLHVSVPRRASRLRTASHPRIRLADRPDPHLVVHWSRGEPTGDRVAVSAQEALAQVAACWAVRDNL